MAAACQVPDLFYRAVVKKKDTAHPRAVVIRFPEDGSTFWLPVDEVGFLHPQAVLCLTAVSEPASWLCD